MYGGTCRFACIYLCGSRTFKLQKEIKLRNDYHASIDMFSHLSFFYTPRGIDLFFFVIM